MVAAVVVAAAAAAVLVVVVLVLVVVWHGVPELRVHDILLHLVPTEAIGQLLQQVIPTCDYRQIPVEHLEEWVKPGHGLARRHGFVILHRYTVAQLGAWIHDRVCICQWVDPWACSLFGQLLRWRTDLVEVERVGVRRGAVIGPVKWAGEPNVSERGSK